MRVRAGNGLAKLLGEERRAVGGDGEKGSAWQGESAFVDPGRALGCGVRAALNVRPWNSSGSQVGAWPGQFCGGSRQL